MFNRLSITVTLGVIVLTLTGLPRLQAKQKDPRTPLEKECDNAYGRCLVKCSGNDMQCIHACDRGWNNCNGYTGTSHRPPPHIKLPTGPLEHLPNVGVGVQKSGAKVSPTPTATPKPKTKKKE